MRRSRRYFFLSPFAAACSRRRVHELTVFSWAGPWETTFRLHLKPLFERITGAKVTFDTGWGEEIPRLLASPPDQPPYDVMIAAPFSVYPVIRRGHFARLDFGKIPNLGLFAPSALDNWIARGEWGLTWPDALHTAIYRTDLTGPSPATWADILALAPGLYQRSYMSLYTFAAAMAPGRAAEVIDNDFEAVFRFAASRRAQVAHWWATSPDMAFHLLRGIVRAGNIHSVDVFPMFAERRPVDILVTEDRAHFQAMWLVPKGTRYLALAHEFLNQFASVAFQQAYAAAGFPTPIEQVARTQAAADTRWARLYPQSANELQRVRYYPYDTYVKHWTDMTDRWNTEVLAA